VHEFVEDRLRLGQVGAELSVRKELLLPLYETVGDGERGGGTRETGVTTGASLVQIYGECYVDHLKTLYGWAREKHKQTNSKQ